MSRRAWLAALCLPALLMAGCGNALSSLDAVQRSQHELFSMRITPDFARRGQTVFITLDLDPALTERLAGQLAYPSEINFGPGTALRSFSTEGDGTMSAEVLISPLAEEGERKPLLVFVVDDSICETQGSFWILPSLPVE